MLNYWDPEASAETDGERGLTTFREVESVAARLPRGHADLKDQMRRSAAATVRHIAEGANRFEPRDKSNRFLLARAECGECDATLEMALLMGLVRSAQIERMRVLADRIAAMVWRLAVRERNRQGRRISEPGPSASAFPSAKA